MILSLLILDVRSGAARQALADRQALHRMLMSGFPDRTGDEHARESLAVLFRIEPQPGPARILVQSRDTPDWTRLPGGLLATVPESRDLGAALDGVVAGSLLDVRLLANPTRKIDTKSAPDGTRRNGRRVPLSGDDLLRAWFMRKSDAAGLEVAGSVLDAEQPDVLVRPLGVVGGRKRTGSSAEDGLHALTFQGVLFEARARVADPVLLRTAVEQGIGPGKAYGFGLLSLARARP